jgi:DMSO/TMAO reductase YedYZ molybdopterin-dependent catalytic subunit
MNGQVLPPDHGYPVRLLVPGWVGVANTQYRLLGPAYPPDSPPLTNQAVKSAFELPFGATFASGTRQILTGRSWSGLAPIRRVDISTDSGTTWNPAWLKHPNLPNAWVWWSFAWTPPAAGS